MRYPDPATLDATPPVAGLKGALRYVRAYRNRVFVVKLGGAAYLLYLAWRFWRAGIDPDKVHASQGSGFWFGVPPPLPPHARPSSPTRLGTGTAPDPDRPSR